jgi:hypothetical protein
MTTIADIAVELTRNVQDQVAVWQRLLTLSQAQRRALEQQDVHSVHALLQEIEVAMLDRSRTEVRRGMLIAQAAGVLGIPAEDITRDAIVAYCDEAQRDQLVAAAEELRALIVELDAVVGRNAAMLEQELAIIEVLVQGATVDVSARATYGKHGMQQEAPRLRLLDAQV